MRFLSLSVSQSTTKHAGDLHASPLLTLAIDCPLALHNVGLLKVANASCIFLCSHCGIVLPPAYRNVFSAMFNLYYRI